MNSELIDNASYYHTDVIVILVPNRTFIYESSGQSGSSKLVESGGGVHSKEETSHWQFNSLIVDSISKGLICCSSHPVHQIILILKKDLI